MQMVMEKNKAMVEKYLELAKSHFLEFEYFKTKIFPITMKLEGGDKLYKVSGDSGGWTKYGIAYEKNKIIFENFNNFADTTYIEACAISFCLYYLPCGAKIAKEDVKLDLFDMSFNIGTSKAIKLVQRYYGLYQDGLIGKYTEDAIKRLSSEDVYKIRTSFYYRLVDAKSSLNKFMKGWLNRANYILKVK